MICSGPILETQRAAKPAPRTLNRTHIHAGVSRTLKKGESVINLGL